MARIAIGARISRSWSTGVGVYTLRLLEALCRVAPRHRYLLLTTPHAAAPPLGDGLPVEQVPLPYAVGSPGQHLLLPRALRALDIDVLIASHPASAPLWSPCPRLVVVHDLIPLTQPRSYGAAKRWYYRTVVRWSLAGAARVLVDSESTQRDCERLFGLPRERMRVVYAGISDAFRLPSGDGRPGETAPRPYLLYVGNKRPHKNVDRLIEAFALLVGADDPGHDLVIAGRDDPGHIETDASRLRALRDQLGLDGRVRFVGEVPDQELPALYRGARAFVYLSSYEGFGLPPLEAMASGTPVVALRSSSLPEVVGDGGVLLDTAEPAAVARSLRRLLTDDAWRSQLAQRGRRQAQRFSWERAARAVSEEIDGALGLREAA